MKKKKCVPCPFQLCIEAKGNGERKKIFITLLKSTLEQWNECTIDWMCCEQKKYV